MRKAQPRAAANAYARSAALGQILKMNTSLFSKLCWPGQHNFEKREIGGGGDVPRAAASAALLGWYHAVPTGLRVRQDVAGLSGLKIIQETVSWASAASAQAFTLLGFQPVAERVSVLRENVVKAPYLAAF